LADTALEAVGLGYRVTVAADATYPPNSSYLSFGSLESRMDIVSSDQATRLLAANPAGTPMIDA
jgi:hypothetical protein